MKSVIENVLNIINCEILFRFQILLFKFLVYKIVFIIVMSAFRVQYRNFLLAGKCTANKNIMFKRIRYKIKDMF